MEPIQEFSDRGFASFEASNPESLSLLRNTIAEEACELLGIPAGDPSEFMDKFHTRGIAEAALNDFRVCLIERFNRKLDVGRVVFDAFDDTLLRLVGPDIAVQKSANLVIQQPGDIGVSPIHRDAPPNSTFEVVVWIPLVDCYGTKGLSIVDRKDSAECASIMREGGPDTMKQLSELALAPERLASVEFGRAVFFWASLFHAVPVNNEIETRWSLNLRYKNLFSPYGGKGLPDYFQIANLSPLSRMAIENEKQHMLGKK